MKQNVMKILVAFITVALILPTIVFLIFAQDDQQRTSAENNDIRSASNVTFSCSFDTVSNAISFNGTVSHEALIKYRDYTVEIYR